MKSLIKLGSGIAIALCPWLLPLAKAAYPTNTTYYINNTGTPACSNSNAGTSSSAPWCDFTNVNSQTFSQGDQILLYSGGSWSGVMTPLGSGASGNPITIGCYPSASCSTTYPTISSPTYTAQVGGASGDVGVALVEVYEVP